MWIDSEKQRSMHPEKKCNIEWFMEMDFLLIRGDLGGK